MTAKTIITDDDVDAAGYGRASRERVDTLLSWVRDTDRFVLADDLPADYPLGMAGEFLIDLGEYEEAWDVGLEMGRHPRCAPLSGYVVLIRVRLEQDRIDEARALADEMRRDPRLADAMLVEQIAELFEMREVWHEALRWTSIGLRLLEASGREDSMEYDALLSTRFRTRRSAGMPWDATDRDDLHSQEIFDLEPPG